MSAEAITVIAAPIHERAHATVAERLNALRRSGDGAEFIVVGAASESSSAAMAALLSDGADFVVGSRFAGGGAAGPMGPVRRLTHAAARWAARPFARLTDPTSRCFALRRRLLDEAQPLRPIGPALALEVLVKTRPTRVVEVGVDAAEAGGNPGLSDWARFAQHLRRLLVQRYPNWSYVLQFAMVGVSGAAVNLGLLTLFRLMGMPRTPAIGLAIFLSMFSNFALNRRFTFSYARGGSVWRQLVGFLASSSLGAVINFSVAATVAATVFKALPVQVAAVCGILAGMTFNFLMSRYVVFSKRQRGVAAGP